MKILIAQDDELSRNLLRTTLAYWGHEVVVASDGTAAWEELTKPGAPHMAILEKRLGGVNGMEVCRKVRARASEVPVYIMLATVPGHAQEITEGMQAGADDFLTKPLDADELMVRLRIAKRVLQMEEELGNAQGAIRYQTTHDPLTGLANRSAVIDALKRELARARREGNPVGVFLAKVDHLKEINEKHGHTAGDAVLREAARRLRSIVRPYDTVGRYGGEEFLVIVPGCGEKSTLGQGERLRTAVAAEEMDVSAWGSYSSANEGNLRMTLSLGVATSEGVIEAERLLRAAEAALARANQSGHDRVELATKKDLT
ncbi:MAG: diguanylate cyclase [Terriglobia bacterium]